MEKKSIIYVNFSPYENVGKILDYILDRFFVIVLFSLNFHRLGPNQQPSKILVYKRRKIIEEIRLRQFSYPSTLIFVFLPLRSIIIFIQIFWHVYWLCKKYGSFEYFFSFNAFIAWVGNILKKYKFVKKTIYWASDYYPPIHPNKIVTFMRWLYWQFDKTTTNSDKLIFINEKLESLRKDIGIIPQRANYPIVPLGTQPVNIPPKKAIKGSIHICFFGVIKKSQGLDLVFENEQGIIKRFRNITFHIIGSGPDEKYFKNRAANSSIDMKFYGLVTNENAIRQIFNSCHIGIAPFIPEEGNVAFYGDPSKIKKYLSYNLPVITTDVFSFSEEIEKYKSGIIIDYYKKGDLLKAIADIMRNYTFYTENARYLAKKYNYKKLYPQLFQLT